MPKPKKKWGIDMDELNKALDICLRGKEAEDAVKSFKEQLKEWELAMPEVKPLVLDFGLGHFRKTGLIEYWIANENKAGYCGKFLFVFDGQTCPMHRHCKKHETFFIVRGMVTMEYDGKSMNMSEGDVLPVEQWKYHSFTGKGSALLLEISTPCEIDDNYFEDSSIPIGENYKSERKE